MLDCASRFWISACRNACNEADDPLLETSVDAEPPVVLLVAVDPVEVDPAVLVPLVLDPDPAALDPTVVDVEVVFVVLLAAVDPVAAVDVASLLEPVGFSALTSAWKSCCSLDNALSLEPDEDPDGLVRLCSRF
jgi:hypothetical protein